MAQIIVAIPHSHTYFWTQTCLASMIRNPPYARGHDVRVIVIDNSPWSPAIKGVTETRLGDRVEVIPNHKSNKFHASALDCVVSRFHFDFLMTLETDVMLLRPDWLEWFLSQMKPTDFAVGMWHHEQFINPSCTLYRGSVLRDMMRWCVGKSICGVENVPDEELRWGNGFSLTAPLDNNLPLTENPQSALRDIKGWIAGPFAEKRGFAEGTVLKEPPSGQLKGPGWYEPGQQLHAWAVAMGYTYTVCPTMTTHVDGVPAQTLYGSAMHDPQRHLEAIELFGNACTAHLWGGTRALDILKHPVTCEFVKKNTPRWLAREARFWKSVVPDDVRGVTLELIRRYGWHHTGQGNSVPGGDGRDREAVDYVRDCYKEGGVDWLEGYPGPIGTTSG